MTLDEKIGQTVLFSAGWEVTGSTLDEKYIDYLNKKKGNIADSLMVGVRGLFAA